MAYITTCPNCGKLYEEQSKESADSPDRECAACWKKRQEAIKKDGHGWASTPTAPWEYR